MKYNKQKIKKQLFINSQPWILSGQTKSKQYHPDNRYRLGDYKAFLVGTENINELSWVCDQFPGSLLDQFYNRLMKAGLSTGKDNWKKRVAIWDEMLSEHLRDNKKYNGVSVSLRIGDIMPWRTSMWAESSPDRNNMYYKPKGFHKIYISPEEYKNKIQRIVKHTGKCKARLIAGIYVDLGLEYNDSVDIELEKQYLYIESIANIFNSVGYDTTIDCGHPDDDYLKLINTDKLILSRGSFSKHSGQSCHDFGGTVHGTYRIDPGGVKSFCVPETLPQPNDKALYENLNDTYWTNI